MELFKEEIFKLNDSPQFISMMTKQEQNKLLVNTIKYNARKKGIEKGLKDGAKQNSIEIAKSLLSMGCNTKEQISQATGLSMKEIEKLK